MIHKENVMNHFAEKLQFRLRGSSANVKAHACMVRVRQGHDTITHEHGTITGILL